MTGPDKPDVDSVLTKLKDFQRATVDYVHQRLWLDDDPAHRFLVADEVGLGKTMVASGVIARTLDHLKDSSERIDIVYICSNGQIARQNISRLNITGNELNHADRLTLLGKQLAGLRERRVNLVSFTPGTSFAIGEASGRKEERAFIFALLRKRLGREAVGAKAWQQFFRDNASAESFERAVKDLSHDDLDDQLAAGLEHAITTQTFGDEGVTLIRALEDCVSRFRYLREGKSVDPEVRQTRVKLIGRLRSIIAGAAITSLRPTLVILDEFQRFKSLLKEDEPTARLAHDLFASEGTRVLMLSATPYKMFTLPDEPEGEDHYQDFEATIRFLAGDDTATQVGRDLATMRRAILDPAAKIAGQSARDRVESSLRRCMVRTERLASTSDRNGMLREEQTAVMLTARDVVAYRTEQQVTELLGHTDVLEYWRSAPYLFNLMDDYQLKKKFEAAIDSEPAKLATLLRQGDGLLDWAALERYEQLDPGNAKLRALTQDVLDRGAWRLLWLPPALPYYTMNGDYVREELASFTKRLVFSAWNVVPKAISTLMSYEAERKAATRVDADRRHGATPRSLLNFSRTSGRLSGMPVLGMLYPSPVLAEIGDPLAICRWAGEIPLGRGRFDARLRDEVQRLLDRLPDGPSDGPVDQAWYWAVPFMLDRDRENQQEFLETMLRWGNAGDEENPDAGGSAQRDHIQNAADFDPASLGRRPDDLAQVIGMLAVAGPGNVALRALHRVSPDLALTSPDLREAASTVSWAVRTLFNQPQATDIVRWGTRDEAYWRAVLDHCHAGCFQAVLDEWVHVLTESEGKAGVNPLDRVWTVAEVIEQAMTLRRTNTRVDDYRVESDRVVVSADRRTLATHFAVRFGRDASDTEKIQDREQAVRRSFNSPFWPFVLASTSVGQEGLDFHLYSHAVVHWNLPGNPVDLEQREGRVHRYKNHAVRKNVAARYNQAVLDDENDDPWAAVFAAAVADRPEGASDLVPFWIFAPEGGAVIERYVPALPLSKEAARYHRLRRTVGAYRMTFGQPRQEDLLTYVASDDVDLSWLAIDLSPGNAPASDGIGR